MRLCFTFVLFSSHRRRLTELLQFIPFYSIGCHKKVKFLSFTECLQNKRRTYFVLQNGYLNNVINSLLINVET